MRRSIALIALLAVVACRTGRPAGVAVVPLSAATREDAIAQLAQRRANFHGMKSLMRVRATNGKTTQSFRAQLIVHDNQRMELIAYTPVGTTALKMKANGSRIESDPEVTPEAFAFLRDSGLTPAEMGMLVLGLPPRDDTTWTFTAGGLARVDIGEVMAVFDPPAFPAKRVTISTTRDHIEIEHLEVVSE
ncbi:MAG: hypothetical protein DMF56_18540 [Acidobacteria bacterium]|nr:MAG: hypothetical protein DMF56_18540 [Acidobacteriota bacterium]